MTSINEFESISIIGLGYIGLPTAAIFARNKIKVIGVEVNQHIVDTINRGGIHIIEPDLNDAVHIAVNEGYLRATIKPEPASAFLIAVPTPFKKDQDSSHVPDMSYIESASKSIAPVLKKGDLVVLESTSPVGATEQMAALLAEARQDLKFPQTYGEDSDIRIAYCPERVLPGKVMHELVQNDRVIGGITPKCSQMAARLYKIFVKGECVLTSARTAEMCKLTENSFRDVNIAFANELSIICDKLAIDVWDLIELANRHPRVNILQPGPGVGGHCIAVDPWFIVSAIPKESRIIRTAREVNDEKPRWVMEKIMQAISKFLYKNPGKTASDVSVSFFGLAFKPNIDDLRESPSLQIAIEFSNQHVGKSFAVEPNISSLCNLTSSLELVTIERGLTSDIAVLLVDHQQFLDIKPTSEFIIDTKGIWRLKS